MNNDVKFRIWDLKAKVYIQQDPDCPIFMNPLTGKEIRDFGYSFCDEPADKDWQDVTDDRYRFEQYTGLKDMFGKEIYEGDILNGKWGDAREGDRIHQVVRVPGGFAINIFADEVEKMLFYNSLADQQNAGYVQGCCSVIGNINQDGERLKNSPLFAK